MKVLQSIILFLFISSAASADTVVAGYRSDFVYDAPLTEGWQYLWNAPSGWVANVSSGDQRSGFIGVPGDYVPLLDAGTTWTPDGDGDGSNNTPGSYLKLTEGGGHPGRHATGSNLRARFAIAAFTVPEDGIYTVTNSYLTKISAAGDGLEVLVFPGISSPVLRREVEPGGTVDFDVRIGYLDAGQTIYVAVGSGATATSDAFQMDYDIVHTPGTNIQQQIDYAVMEGRTHVVVEPGRYYSAKTARHVDLNELTNLVIEAEGVTLIGQTPYRGFELEDCHNVTVTGLTLDYDPVLHVQGTVENFGANWLDLRIHEGYPLPENASGSGMLYEPSGDVPLKQGGAQRFLKTDGTAFLPLEPDLFRYTFSQSSTDTIAVGDYFSMVQSIVIPHGIALVDSAEITLRRVAVHCAPTFGIIVFGGGDLTFDEVEVVPGEQPLLASVKRLRSSGADGIHVRASTGNVRMTGCRTEYAGDDCLVLTSPYAMVIDAPAEDVARVVFKTAEPYRAGDGIELYEHATTQKVYRTLVSMTEAPLTETEVEALTDLYFPQGRFVEYTAYDLELDTPVNAQPGDFISNESQSNEGYLIADCYVENTRARGILVKAGDGIVSNCTVKTTWLAGLQMRPDPVLWLEGDYVHDMQVIGNTIINCGINSYSKGAIRIDSEDASGWNRLGHEKILLEDNVVSNSPGLSLWMACAVDVELRNNRFYDSHEWMVVADEWNESVIWLDTVDNVSFTGTNWVYNLGTSADRDNLIGYGDDVGAVSGRLYRPLAEVVPERNPVYITWQNEYALVGNAEGDDDGDRLSNFAEFAQGGNPTNGNHTGYTPAIVTGDGSIGYVHVQRMNAGVGYGLEFTDDLVCGKWSAGEYTAVSTNQLHGQFSVVTNYIGHAGSSNGFIRLMLEQL